LPPPDTQKNPNAAWKRLPPKPLLMVSQMGQGEKKHFFTVALAALFRVGRRHCTSGVKLSS
jgi:hypothetical protein